MLNKFLVLILVFLVWFPGGCQDPKEKYPDFPQWGWWDRPAKPAEPEDESPPLAGDVETEKTPAQAPPAGKLTGQNLEEYREKVWPEVSVLRNTDAMTTEHHTRTLANAKANIAQWYRPMPIAKPDVTKQDWTTVVIWDFMPEEEFIRASNTWQKIADEQGVELPKVVTRRNLMRFVQKMISGELRPRPRTRPAS